MLAGNSPDLFDLFNLVYFFPDPELPFISIGELGMVHRIEITPMKMIRVEYIPSFLGCPANGVIQSALEKIVKDFSPNTLSCIEKVYAPLWGIHRISDQGREKLRLNKIAVDQEKCPYCQSEQLLLVSAFSSTPCKKLMKCSLCGQPFEAMKCSIGRAP